MTRLQAGPVAVLTVCYFYFFLLGTYSATNLEPTEGNWTWSEANLHCRRENTRLAYKDEITLPVNMSDREIMEDDVLYWINENTWPSEIQYPCGCLETSEVHGSPPVESVRSPDECALCCKDFPSFALKDSACLCKANISCPPNRTKCEDSDKYQLYSHIEPPEQCLVMYQIEQLDFIATFVNCTMKAGMLCRTDVVKAMKGTQFTWSEAHALCLNASSQLVNLNMVSDLERSRSIDTVNIRHYWTNGVVKHGLAGQFQIVDCIEASVMSGTDQIFAQHYRNSVYNCNQLCEDNGRIALMGEHCRCLRKDENLTDATTNGCTTPCVGNTRDRCGGNNSFSVYQRLLSEQEQLSDVCLSITKNSDNNITEHWELCRQRLDGCICRNGTNATDSVIYEGNITWPEAQVECESHHMMLAVYETSPIGEDQLSGVRDGANLWTGVYSPTVLEFNSDEIQDGDKCLSVTNFRKPELDTEEKDCNTPQGVICHNDDGILLDITTLPDDHVIPEKTSPAVTTVRMITSTIPETTTSPAFTGMSPMIIGLIVTVVLVGLVLAIILGVLAVLLHRFKEQKRQLNMLKGPTISYSNLEHSVVVSYNGAPSNEDSGTDIGNFDNITEQLDAQFMLKDEMSPDEKSEHLYDISDNVDNKPSIKRENGILNSKRKTPPEPEDDAYTEVVLCEETGNPAIVSNRNSRNSRNSSSSGEVRNLEMSKNEQRTPLLKVTEKYNESVDKNNEGTENVTFNDDVYDDADSCARRCSNEIDMDTYDELENKSCKRPKSNTECLYDHVNNDSYDEIKTGVAAKGKIHYEDVDLNFGLPSDTDDRKC